MALLQLLEIIYTTTDNDEYALGIFFDLYKAFLHSSQVSRMP